MLDGKIKTLKSLCVCLIAFFHRRKQNTQTFVSRIRTLGLKAPMVFGNFFNYIFCFREISTLRGQVEQMLQKILPLEKCQEELGSLKAELEEKKVCL